MAAYESLHSNDGIGSSRIPSEKGRGEIREQEIHTRRSEREPQFCPNYIQNDESN